MSILKRIKTLLRISTTAKSENCSTAPATLQRQTFYLGMKQLLKQSDYEISINGTEKNVGLM